MPKRRYIQKRMCNHKSDLPLFFNVIIPDKLDEDVLYSWYRNLFEMFYKEGFRLYHTTSNDLLCLQVTMMQSCIYYLSLVRIPQHRIFVLHPPADLGMI